MTLLVIRCATRRDDTAMTHDGNDGNGRYAHVVAVTIQPRSEASQSYTCSPRRVVRGGVEPPTFRFSGAFVWSLHVAGCGLMGDLAATTMAGCRLMRPGVCRVLAPRLAPHFVGPPTFSTASRLTDRSATKCPCGASRPSPPVWRPRAALPSWLRAPEGPLSSLSGGALIRAAADRSAGDHAMAVDLVRCR
jgi:hypothetical protein